VALEEDTPEFAAKIRAAAPAERRELYQQARERSRNALLDLTAQWLQHASRPEFAACEKWTLFLGNVYVVAARKVQNSALLYRHQDTLRRNCTGTAPELTKAVLRSPAMINYLDLQQNRNGAPNENFARELMELFTLGIGHYTENDIKEAARAFTGYVQRFGDYRFDPRQHDASPKTIFGHTGNFDGDGVIDLIYTQKAAGTHLPALLTRFYLTDETLPDGYLDALGDWWRGTGFDLRQLAQRYFSSRLFFAPAVSRRLHQESGAVFPRSHAGFFARRAAAPAADRTRLSPDGPGALRPAQRPRLGRRTRMDQLDHDRGAARAGAGVFPAL
jgi:uncharacterized protein (DUF1800 family)